MPNSHMVKSGRVASRPRQAGDEAGADRVADLGEDDRDGAADLQQRNNDRRTHGQDDFRRERDQFRSVTGIAPAIPAVVDLKVASDVPTQFAKPLQKRPVAGL